MRVDFYVTEGSDPREVLEVAGALCHKAVETQLDTTVLVQDEAQQKALDDWLWAHPAESFLPHGIDDTEQPVNLVRKEPKTGTGLLINLSARPAQGEGYERVAEVVSAGAREAGRDKFRFHRTRLGEAPATHKIKARYDHG